MRRIATITILGLACAGVSGAAHASGDAQNGAKLVEAHACVSCHGAQFNNPIDPSYPRLAGQHPDYLEEALRGYKDPKNPSIGRNNAVMNGMAATLSDSEISDIAAYLGSLPAAVHMPRSTEKPH